MPWSKWLTLQKQLCWASTKNLPHAGLSAGLGTASLSCPNQHGCTGLEQALLFSLALQPPRCHRGDRHMVPPPSCPSQAPAEGARAQRPRGRHDAARSGLVSLPLKCTRTQVCAELPLRRRKCVPVPQKATGASPPRSDCLQGLSFSHSTAGMGERRGGRERGVLWTGQE